MKASIMISTIALVLAATPALAQTKATAAGKATAEEKFVAADRDKSGQLEGAEATPYRVAMAKIDANKDGKISKAEFVAAAKAGVIR